MFNQEYLPFKTAFLLTTYDLQPTTNIYVS